MPSGVKSFILFRRFPGSKNPARRTLGSYNEISLADAREKAREWVALVKKGIDPGIQEQRLRQAAIEAEKKRQISTFGAAFDAYLGRKASRLRTGKDIEREIRRECKGWMVVPLADVKPSDVKELIGTISKRGETQAHVIFGMLRTFFNWVIDSATSTLIPRPAPKLSLPF